MLGYPPRVLLKAVEKRAGAEAHARVRRTAGFADDRRFRMTEDCSVDDIERLIDAVAEVLGMTRTAVEE